MIYILQINMHWSAPAHKLLAQFVGCDFNARALERVTPYPDSKGKRNLEMAAKTRSAALNTGSMPTFRRPSCEESILDFRV